MNAVEKLRSFLPSEFKAWETDSVIRKPGKDITAEKIAAIADEIENTYMKLPVDADGVPIRPGDEVLFTNGQVIKGVVEAVGETWVAFGDRPFYGCNSCRHVKPETVESILEEFFFAVKSRERIQNTTIDEYADRIRALEGGDNE